MQTQIQHPNYDAYLKRHSTQTKKKLVRLEPMAGMQTKALRSPAQEILLGGEAGGGKSWLILFCDLVDIQRFPKMRTLTLRRTSPQLGRLLEMGQEFLSPMGFKFSSQDREYNKPSFMHPNGAKMIFGHMQHEKDKHNYQGMEFQRLHFDELTHFTESQYSYLLSRVRGTNGIPLQIINSANPDGENLQWVKRRWIDKLKAHELGAFTRNAAGREIRVPFHTPNSMIRQWIPSIRAENTNLGAEYEAMLAQLPPEMYRALALGLWETHDRAFQLIRGVWIDKAFSGDIEPDGQDEGWTIAMDYADGGQDKCVTISGKGNTPYFIRSDPYMDTYKAAEMLYEEMKKRGIYNTKVGIDTGGVGIGVYHTLVRILEDSPHKQAVWNIWKLDHKTDDWRERFKGQLKPINFRAQGYWQLRQDFEQGRINLRHLIETECDYIDDIQKELLAHTYNPDGEWLKIIEKTELRKAENLGHSPDYADALMYWNFTRSRELMRGDAGDKHARDYGIEPEDWETEEESAEEATLWV